MADSRPRKDGAQAGPARLTGVGFTFVVIVVIPTVIGYFLDRFAGTLPLFLLIGLFLGFAGGLYYVYLEMKKLGGG